MFHEQPTDPWKPWDFKLIQAYQMLQDEICPRCGQPVWVCRSSSADVWFEAEEGVCQGERAVRSAEDAKKPSKERADQAERKTWGRFFYPVPRVTEGKEMPTREEYYEELSKSTGKIG